MRILTLLLIIFLLFGCHRTPPKSDNIKLPNFVCYPANAVLRQTQSVGSYSDTVQRSLYTIDATAYQPFPLVDYYEKMNRLNPYWASFGNQNLLPVSKLPRVVAYTFRGDHRDPHTLKQEHGFTYWKIKNDYEIFSLKWRSHLYIKQNSVDTILSEALYKNPNFFYENELNPYTHTLSPIGSNFVSTSRSSLIAKKYASNGWVYIVRAVGGFDLPHLEINPISPELPYPYADHYEQEIAIPGDVAFDNIVAYTRTKDGKFIGDVCISEKIVTAKPKVSKKFLAVLSGDVNAL